MVFEFHPGRGKIFARELAGDFQGYLQRDGYGVYGARAADPPGLIGVGCWSPARRKLVDALDERPGPAAEVVSEIRKRCLVERPARDACLAPAERRVVRKKISAPLLTARQPKLVTVQEASLPQSPLGKAARDALGEWAPLTRDLEDGRLEIANNLTENAIRPSAVDKKNWRFIGHPEAGWRSATIYSVIVSCRRRGMDPWAYLRDVLTRLPGLKQSELTAVWPRNGKSGGRSGEPSSVQPMHLTGRLRNDCITSGRLDTPCWWFSNLVRSSFSRSASFSFATLSTVVSSERQMSLPPTRIRAKYVPLGT